MENISLNMLLLRQFVSVLPMLVAITILVYLQTRFQSYFKSISLFLILLIVPGVVFNNMWIHPDSLVFLFIVLTFFFLDRDDLQFGKNFYLAALACGLAVATKLIGLFFFLAIPYYIFLGWHKGRIDLRKAVIAAILFVSIMFSVFVLANPFLFWALERHLRLTQSNLHDAMGSGFIVSYSDDPLIWLRVFQTWYGLPIFILFAFISTVIGAFKGERRLLNQLILFWSVQFMFYIAFALVIRAKHFPLPILLPVFSALPAYFILFEPARFFKPIGEYLKKNAIRLGLTLIGLLIVGAQVFFSLERDISYIQKIFITKRPAPPFKVLSKIEQDYLSKIVLDRQLVIFRDWMMYIPNSPAYKDYFKWGVSDYGIATKQDPDLLMLNKQHLYDYTQPGQLVGAKDPDFALTVEFKKDALNGTVKDYTLLYQDDFGVYFIKTPLYDQFFALSLTWRIEMSQ